MLPVDGFPFRGDEAVGGFGWLLAWVGGLESQISRKMGETIETDETSETGD
jgi:hypothetical protein